MSSLKTIILLILLIGLFSCSKDDKVIIKKYDSGKIKAKYYFTETYLDSVYQFYEFPNILKSITRVLSDSTQFVTLYDKVGKIKMEGNTILKNEKYLENGWWKKNGATHTTHMQYFVIGDTTKVNQAIIKDKEGNVKNNSHYYEIDLADTIQQGKLYHFHIKLNTPTKGIKQAYRAGLKLSDSIRLDFTNYWEAKNTYNIKEIEPNLWEIAHTFDKQGFFNIRGIIISTYVEHETINKDSLRFIRSQKITFVDKEIYIQ